MVYPFAVSQPDEIPQMVADLYSMSKEYLRQETVEPAKRLTRVLRYGLMSGVLFSLAALIGAGGLYSLLRTVLPEGAWWLVAARGGTALVSLAAAAGIVTGARR